MPVSFSRLIPWLLIIALWGLLHGTLVQLGTSPILEGNLVDPDSFMRLVRVTRLYETGAWYDVSVPRINAPYGDILHWTRPFDVVLLVGAWLLAPFLGFKAGLFWVGAAISPLLSLVAAVALYWAVAPLFERRLRYLTVVVFLLQPAVLVYAMAGRADHHVLQVVLMVVFGGLVLRLLTRPFDRNTALGAGVAAGLGIWVSVEFLVALACALSVLGLVWVRFHGGWARVNLTFAAGLAIMVALALVIERPPAQLLAVEYDRISVVHLVIAVIVFAYWYAVTVLPMATAWIAGPGRRLAIGIGGAGVGGLLLAVLFPKFFAGPMADVDPMLFTVWMDFVGEMKPMWPTDMVGLGKMIFFVGAATICLPFSAIVVWTERDRDRWAAWAFMGLGLAVFLVLALQHVRFVPYAEVALAPIVAEIIGRVRKWTRALRPEPFRLAVRVAASSSLLVGSLAAGAAVTSANRPPQSVAGGGKCPIPSVARYLDRQDGFGDRPRLIAAMIDHGPELVYRTKHSVLAGPYHRNRQGILDNHRIIAAADAADSRRLIARRGVGLVLLCPLESERKVFLTGTAGTTLYQQLIEGNPPSWLRQVELPASLAEYFRLYEVRG